MSVAIMTLVWKLDLPDSEKIVMLALADCANDEGLAWPSMATLSRKCSKSERTCQTVMRSLEAKGLVEREEIKGKGCKYWVKANTPAAVAPRKDCTPAEDAPPQPLPLTPAAVAPKPSRTPSVALATSGRARKPEAKFVLPDWIPQDPWDGWMAMRKAKGIKDTDHARDLAVGKLAKLKAQGFAPGEVLDQSTLQFWTGLFEIKGGNARQQSTPSLGADLSSMLAAGRARLTTPQAA